MSKKTLLIIVTYNYPFNPPVEQFLDDEIQYLCKENVDIMLVPISRCDNGIMYNSVQNNSNIKVCRLSRYGKIFETLIGTFYSVRYIKSLFFDLSNIKKNVDKIYRNFARKETLKQYVQGCALYNEIMRQIPEEEIVDREKLVLYSYWLSPAMLSVGIIKNVLNKKYGIPVKAYSRAHGDGDLYHKGLEKYRPCKEIINSNIDCIFSISENGSRYLKAQGLKCVETQRLGVEKVSVEDFTINDIPLIVSCSVINDNKRVDKIADIISKLDVEVRWIHFGSGPNEDKLKAYCEEILTSKVHWELKGWTKHEVIMESYRTMHPDLFINVSKVEGIPVSIMEAMSFSIPCIATAVGASNEIVIDGVNGYLIQQDFDVVNVAQTIKSYFELKKDAKIQMRINAYEQFTRLFNAEMNYGNFAKRIIQLGES